MKIQFKNHHLNKWLDSALDNLKCGEKESSIEEALTFTSWLYNKGKHTLDIHRLAPSNTKEEYIN